MCGVYTYLNVRVLDTVSLFNGHVIKRNHSNAKLSAFKHRETSLFFATFTCAGAGKKQQKQVESLM